MYGVLFLFTYGRNTLYLPSVRAESLPPLNRYIIRFRKLIPFPYRFSQSIPNILVPSPIVPIKSNSIKSKNTNADTSSSPKNKRAQFRIFPDESRLSVIIFFPQCRSRWKQSCFDLTLGNFYAKHKL